LDWFALKADADLRQLELQAVTLDYRQTVMAGWEEARSGLAAYAAAVDREALSEQALGLANAEKALQLALLDAGAGTRQALLEAELAANQRAITLAGEHFGALQAWARLMKASFVVAVDR
jgi:outer membrane protein TolC